MATKGCGCELRLKKGDKDTKDMTLSLEHNGTRQWTAAATPTQRYEEVRGLFVWAVTQC